MKRFSVCGLLTCFLSVVCLFVMSGCGGGGGGGNSGRQFPLSGLSRATLTVNGTTLNLYVMETREKRSEGMMKLSESGVGPNDGMIFVYPNEQPRSYWMKDTGIALDIAFIAPNGRVVRTAPLQPYDTNHTASGEPAQYAIEVRQGTLARVGITEGMILTLPPLPAGTD